MKVRYKGQTLKYIPDFYGQEVLWIQHPSQISMPGMKCVGHPDEYCIYIDSLTEAEQEEIRRQVKK